MQITPIVDILFVAVVAVFVVVDVVAGTVARPTTMLPNLSKKIARSPPRIEPGLAACEAEAVPLSTATASTTRSISWDFRSTRCPLHALSGGNKK